MATQSASSSDTPPPNLIGTQLGDYILRAPIGRGGMGAVFVADHAFLKMPFAVKVLSPKLATDKIYLERFFREARQAARIQHRNVVAVHGASKIGSLAYIAMEYVPGSSLRDAVRATPDRRLPARVAVDAAIHALEGLSAAHELGTVHRDIKPDNLLLDPNGVVKVADFGLARDLVAGSNDPTITRAGQIMGTPAFMSPEQWEGSNVDAATDLYALGVTLFYLLSGSLPYTGDRAAAIMLAAMQGEGKRLRQVAPNLDRELVAIVEQLMAVDRERRPASAREAIRLLDRWRGGTTTGATLGETMVETESQPHLARSGSSRPGPATEGVSSQDELDRTVGLTTLQQLATRRRSREEIESDAAEVGAPRPGAPSDNHLRPIQVGVGVNPSGDEMDAIAFDDSIISDPEAEPYEPTMHAPGRSRHTKAETDPRRAPQGFDRIRDVANRVGETKVAAAFADYEQDADEYLPSGGGAAPWAVGGRVAPGVPLFAALDIDDKGMRREDTEAGDQARQAKAGDPNKIPHGRPSWIMLLIGVAVLAGIAYLGWMQWQPVLDEMNESAESPGVTSE